MEVALVVLSLVAVGGAALFFARWRAAEARAADAAAEKSRVAGEVQSARESESQARREAAVEKSRAEQLESQLQDEQRRAENRAADIESAMESLRRANADAQARVAELQTARDLDAESAREKIALLQKAREEMREQFENLAQQILEKKGAAFDAAAREKMAGLVRPLADDLEKFRARAEEIHNARSRESAALRENIAELQKNAGQIAADANNLTSALKGDKKALGDWGEVTLERLLEDSGLRRGDEYEAQAATVGEDGKPQRPDFKIILPEGRHLIVDSKASLVAYHDYVSAQGDAERQRALSAHVAAVRNHAKALGEKHYQRGRGVNSPDFVLMFMPIEAAWMTALLNDDRLFDDAYERRVILVSRTTLLPTLKTVAQLWKFERQTREAREAFELAGRMLNKFAALLDEMRKIDEALLRARNVHQDAMRKLEGRDNLLGQAQRLAEMGANPKRKLPERLTGDGGE